MKKATIGRWWYDNNSTSYSYIQNDGNMFDLEAKSEVTIYGIDLPRNSLDDTFEVEVYVTKAAGLDVSFAGKEHDPAKWTLVANTYVTLSKSGIMITLDTPFSIGANEKRGIYVTFKENGFLISLVEDNPLILELWL